MGCNQQNAVTTNVTSALGGRWLESPTEPTRHCREPCGVPLGLAAVSHHGLAALLALCWLCSLVRRLILSSSPRTHSLFLVSTTWHSKMPLLPGFSSWSPDQYTSLFSISAELGCGVYLHLTTFFLSVLYAFPSPEKLPLCCMHWRLVSFSSPRANTLDTNRSQGLETLKSVETIRVQSIYNTGSTEMHHCPRFY